MSGQTGRSFKMAFAKFGTNSWGVAASVTKGIYFEGDAGMQLKPAMITDNAFNQPFLGPADPGLIEAPSLSLANNEPLNPYLPVCRWRSKKARACEPIRVQSSTPR